MESKLNMGRLYIKASLKRVNLIYDTGRYPLYPNIYRWINEKETKPLCVSSRVFVLQGYIDTRETMWVKALDTVCTVWIKVGPN